MRADAPAAYKHIGDGRAFWRIRYSDRMMPDGAVECGRAKKRKQRGTAVLDRLHAAVFAAVLVSIGLAAAAARAQDYPTRPVTVIVPSTPGGGTDINARIIGDKLSQELGQPF